MLPLSDRFSKPAEGSHFGFTLAAMLQSALSKSAGFGFHSTLRRERRSTPLLSLHAGPTFTFFISLSNFHAASLPNFRSLIHCCSAVYNLLFTVLNGKSRISAI